MALWQGMLNYSWVGLSMGWVSSGLGLTQTRPNWIEL